MDIEKEREAFEKSIAANIENFCYADFDGKYYVMRNNSRLKQRDKEFLILSLNRSWAAWQAAKADAVPEGYVLMPKEPTDAMVEAGKDSSECGGWPDEIYKAMIEAQEQANESE